MKFSELIANLKSPQWLDLQGFCMLFIELDFARKFGMSENSLKTELLNLKLLNSRVEQERDFDEYIRKHYCRLQSSDLSVHQAHNLLDELASKCKYSTMESGQQMHESNRTRSEIIFDLFKVFQIFKLIGTK